MLSTCRGQCHNRTAGCFGRFRLEALSLKKAEVAFLFDHSEDLLKGHDLIENHTEIYDSRKNIKPRD